MSGTVALDAVTIADFEPWIASDFFLALPHARTISLTLQSAAPLGRPGAASPGRQPFSLIFTGTDAVKLPQQIYPLQHDALGLLEIFLVPISEENGRRQYEAIFS